MDSLPAPAMYGSFYLYVSSLNFRKTYLFLVVQYICIVNSYIQDTFEQFYTILGPIFLQLGMVIAFGLWNLPLP
jgi:hypothetical protein